MKMKSMNKIVKLHYDKGDIILTYISSLFFA